MKYIIVLSLIFYTSLFAQYEKGKIEMHGGKTEKLFDEKINMLNTTFSTLWGKKKDTKIQEDIKKTNYIKIDSIEKIDNIGQ